MNEFKCGDLIQIKYSDHFEAIGIYIKTDADKHSYVKYLKIINKRDDLWYANIKVDGKHKLWPNKYISKIYLYQEIKYLL
jgi:hypothetical protein